MIRSEGYLISLLKELRTFTNKTGWVEFKVNNDDPEAIGEYISALSNSAALNGKTKAYMVWGIEDENHDVVGTTFMGKNAKKGNEDLESWLLRLLSPKIIFTFYELTLEDKKVVILEIERAADKPVQFKGSEYIRVGSYKKILRTFQKSKENCGEYLTTSPSSQ